MPDEQLSPGLQEQALAVVEKRIAPEQRLAFAKYVKRRQSKFKCEPVEIEEFLTSKEYLGKAGEIYPRVMEALCKLLSGPYQEAVLTGAIGTAKTTIAVYCMAWGLYQLSILRNPHREFGLDPSSEIVIIFQSLNAKLAKSVGYARFKALIQASPYFQRHFPFDPKVESEMYFPHRIIVRPVTGDVAGAIGQNVIGGVIDEVNHMEKVVRSRRSIDGGDYDQIVALYNSIVRRRKSRFLKHGNLPGILCLVGSKRYPGQFTDQRVEAAKSDPTIYVYDRRSWDVLPPDRFCGEWFSVFIGNDHQQPRILGAGESGHPKELVMRVPVEYREDFERDIHEALREIGGVSTLAAHPYFTNREAVAKCFGKHKSLLTRTKIDFEQESLRVHKRQIRDAELRRWVHCDLALTGDCAGIVCGYVPEIVSVQRGESIEKLPRICIDFTLRVVPPRGGEINFERIRQMIYALKDNGLNIIWVSFDSFQSRDSIQQLRRKGFQSDLRSVDRDTTPYDFTKSALYDGRVDLPKDDFLMSELLGLEVDHQRGKIDHRPNASKDVADALAGVVHGLSTRRETWTRHGISPSVGQSSLYLSGEAVTDQTDDA